LITGLPSGRPGDPSANARFVATFAAWTGCENVTVNVTAGPAKVPGPEPGDVVFVTRPNVPVNPDPYGTVRDGSAVTVGMALGATGVRLDAVGDGLAVGDLVAAAVAAGVVAEVLPGVDFEVGFAVDCAPADAAAAEASALAAAESAGGDTGTPMDDIAALGDALDAAADGGPDDAAAL